MAAREEYARRRVQFEYINVKKDRAGLDRMLEVTGGRRDVPVILEGDKVTIGFGGSCGV